MNSDCIEYKKGEKKRRNKNKKEYRKEQHDEECEKEEMGDKLAMHMSREGNSEEEKVSGKNPKNKESKYLLSN